MFLGRKRVPLTELTFPSLRSVYGLGNTRIRLIIAKLGITPKRKLAKIPSIIRNGLSRYIDRHYSTEKLLRKPENTILRQHFRFGSYKGVRMAQGLPCNGQRTRSNAATAHKLRRSLKLI